MALKYDKLTKQWYDPASTTKKLAYRDGAWGEYTDVELIQREYDILAKQQQEEYERIQQIQEMQRREEERKQNRSFIEKLAGNTWAFAARTGKGVLSGLENIILDPATYLTSLIYKAGGNDDAAKALKNFAQDDSALRSLDTLSGGEGQFNRTTDWAGTFVQSDNLVGQLAEVIGDQLAVIGLSVPVPKGATKAQRIAAHVNNYTLQGIRGLSAGTSEAFRDGASAGEAILYGVSNAGLEIVSEWLTGGIPGVKGSQGWLDNLVAKKLGLNDIDEISNSFIKELTKYGYKMAGEGMEEAFTEALIPYLKSAIYDYDGSLDPAEYYSNIFNSFLMGALTSGAIELPGTIGNLNAARKLKKTSEETSTKVVDKMNMDSWEQEFDKLISDENVTVEELRQFQQDLKDNKTELRKVTDVDMERVYNLQQRINEEIIKKTSDPHTEIETINEELDNIEVTTVEDIEEVQQLEKQKEELIKEADEGKAIPVEANREKVRQNKQKNFEEANLYITKLNEKLLLANSPVVKLAENKNINENNKRIVDMAEAFGVQVIFIEGNDSFNGTFLPGEDVVFINTSDKTVSTAVVREDGIPVELNVSKQFAFTIGHEIFHHMKYNNNKLANDFMKYLDDTLDQSQINEYIEYRYGHDQATVEQKRNNRAEVVEEIAADEFGKMFTDKKLFEKIVAYDSVKNTSLAKKIVAYINKVLDALTHTKFRSVLTNDQIKTVRNMFENIVKDVETKYAKQQGEETSKHTKTKLDAENEAYLGKKDAREKAKAKKAEQREAEKQNKPQETKPTVDKKTTVEKPKKELVKKETDTKTKVEKPKSDNFKETLLSKMADKKETTVAKDKTPEKELPQKQEVTKQEVHKPEIKIGNPPKGLLNLVSKYGEYLDNVHKEIGDDAYWFDLRSPYSAYDGESISIHELNLKDVERELKKVTKNEELWKDTEALTQEQIEELEKMADYTINLDKKQLGVIERNGKYIVFNFTNQVPVTNEEFDTMDEAVYESLQYSSGLKTIESSKKETTKTKKETKPKKEIVKKETKKEVVEDINDEIDPDIAKNLKKLKSEKELPKKQTKPTTLSKEDADTIKKQADVAVAESVDRMNKDMKVSKLDETKLLEMQRKSFEDIDNSLKKFPTKDRSTYIHSIVDRYKKYLEKGGKPVKAMEKYTKDVKFDVGKTELPIHKYEREHDVEFTYNEEYAMTQWSGFASYVINSELRNGNALEDSDTGANYKQISDGLSTALQKLPNYNGIVKRSIDLDGQALEKFLDEHKVGNIVTYPAFTSTGVNQIYDDTMNIQMDIISHTGKETTELFRPDEREVLFDKNSSFRVISVDKSDLNNIKIKLEDVSDSPKFDIGLKKGADGETISAGMSKYMKGTYVTDTITPKGKLKLIYHTVNHPVAPFTEFDPVGQHEKGEVGYRFGKQFVTYFTDDKEMSGSYANQEYDLVDTARLNNISEAKKWLKEYLDGNNIFELHRLSDGKFELKAIDFEMSIVYDNEKDMLRNLKEDVHKTLADERKYQYPGYIKMTNPYIVDAEGRYWNEVSYEMDEELKETIDSLTEEDKKYLSSLARESLELHQKWVTSEKYSEYLKYYDAYKRLDENTKLNLVIMSMKENPQAKDYVEIYDNFGDSVDPNETITLSDGKTMSFAEFAENWCEYEMEYTLYGSSYSHFKSNAIKNYSEQLNTIGVTNAHYIATHNFDVEIITDLLAEKYTTNDIVNQVIDMNSLGANYDGVIIKNTIDYGGYSTNKNPHNLFITFSKDQFKAWDNPNPTGDPDIRYDTATSKFATNTVEKTPTLKFYANASDHFSTQYETQSHEQTKQKAVDKYLSSELGMAELKNAAYRVDKGEQVFTADQKVAIVEMLAYNKTLPENQRMSADELTMWVETLIKSDTEAGRAVESNKYLKYLDGKSYALSVENGLLREAYRQTNSDKNITFNDWITNIEETNNFRLTSAEFSYIEDMFDRAMEYEEGSPQRNKRLALIDNVINAKLPAKWGQKANAFRRVAMLTSPKTLGKNTLSQSMMYALEKITRPLGVVGDKLAKTLFKSNVRSVSLRQNTLKTVVADMDNKINEFKKTMDGLKGEELRKAEIELDRMQTERNNMNTRYKDSLDALIEAYNLDIENINSAGYESHQSPQMFKNPIVKYAEKLVYGVLESSDMFFYNEAYNWHIANSVEAYNMNVSDKKKITKPTEQMRLAAVDYALETTFKSKDGLLYKILHGVRDTLNLFKVGGEGAGDILIPYFRTPVNLARTMIKYSPAGYAYTVAEGRRLKKVLNNTKATVYEKQAAQQKFAQSFAKASAGSLLMILATALAKAGSLTGDEPEDERVADLMKANGWRPYSLKIGNKYISYDWADPVSALLKTSTKLAEPSKEDENVLLEAFKYGSSQLSEMATLETYRTLLGASAYGESTFVDGMLDTVASLPASFVPNVFKDIANIIDNNKKVTWDNDPMSRVYQQTAAKIPFLKSTLETKVDTLGNEQEYKFSDIFLPGSVSTYAPNTVANEVLRVYNMTGDSSVLASDIESKITYTDSTGNARKVTLTSKEQNKVQELFGDEYVRLLDDLMRSDLYYNADPIVKAKLMSSVKDYARINAYINSGYFKDYTYKDSSTYGQIKKYTDAGLSLANAIIYDGAISPIVADKDVHGDNIKGTENGKKAYNIMNLNISDNEKNVMLQLISPTSKTPETVDSLSALIDLDDYCNYYAVDKSDYMIQNNFSRADYQTAKAIGMDGTTFVQISNDLANIRSDYNANGEAISGSKKAKVIQYLNNSGLSELEIYYMYAQLGYSIKNYSSRIQTLINQLNLSAADKKAIYAMFFS